MPQQQKKGFLSKIGGMKIAGLIFEEVPTEPVAKTRADDATAAAPADRLARKDVTSSPTVHIDQDTYDTLYGDVVTSEKTAYTDLLAQVNQLKDVIPDERTLFAAAAKTSGSSSQQIISAVGTHLTELDKVQRDFEQETDRRMSQAVSSRESQRANIQSQVEGVDREIDDLNRQISSLNQKKSALKGDYERLGAEISTEKSKIENGRQVFLRAADELRKHLNGERERISNFLKGA